MDIRNTWNFHFIVDWDPRRRRQRDEVNGFVAGATLSVLTSTTLGMLTPDEAHLSRWGKSVLGGKLAGLVSRALNEIQ